MLIECWQYRSKRLNQASFNQFFSEIHESKKIKRQLTHNESIQSGAAYVTFRTLQLEVGSELMKHLKKIERQKFTVHEEKYEWLSMLLDAYHTNFLGVLDEAKLEAKRRKQEIACGKGCHYCCLRPVVPVTQIEVMGISWYVSEIIKDSATRHRLKHQLILHRDRLQCPFLIDEICCIYFVRPIACREYHLFGDPCKENENPEQTRSYDLWSPSRKVARKTALKILPYFGFKSQADMLRAYKQGFIHKNSKPMHQIDWSVVVHAMNCFDKA